MWIKIFNASLLCLLFTFTLLWLTGNYLSRPYLIDNDPTTKDRYQLIDLDNSAQQLMLYQKKQPNARANILLLHGIRAHHQSQISKANMFYEQGFNVYLLDFQAHGLSDGDTVTFGHLESNNVEQALAYIESQSNLKTVSVGMSMGGAASIFAKSKADIMVIEAVYADIQWAIFNRIESHIGSLIATVLTPLLSHQLQWRTGQDLAQFKPNEHIKNIRSPILVIGGSIDDKTPIIETQMLFNQVAHPQKALWVVEGARHENFYEFDRAPYQETVIAFIEQYL